MKPALIPPVVKDQVRWPPRVPGGVPNGRRHRDVIGRMRKRPAPGPMSRGAVHAARGRDIRARALGAQAEAARCHGRGIDRLAKRRHDVRVRGNACRGGARRTVGDRWRRLILRREVAEGDRSRDGATPGSPVVRVAAVLDVARAARDVRPVGDGREPGPAAVRHGRVAGRECRAPRRWRQVRSRSIRKCPNPRPDRRRGRGRRTRHWQGTDSSASNRPRGAGTGEVARSRTKVLVVGDARVQREPGHRRSGSEPMLRSTRCGIGAARRDSSLQGGYRLRPDLAPGV